MNVLLRIPGVRHRISNRIARQKANAVMSASWALSVLHLQAHPMIFDAESRQPEEVLDRQVSQAKYMIAAAVLPFVSADTLRKLWELAWLNQNIDAFQDAGGFSSFSVFEGVIYALSALLACRATVGWMSLDAVKGSFKRTPSDLPQAHGIWVAHNTPASNSLMNEVIACADALLHIQLNANHAFAFGVATSDGFDKAIRRIRRRVPLMSRKDFDEHANAVRGAISKARAEIHKNPEDGLKLFAKLLIKVSERNLEHRFFALLDEDQLRGIEPVEGKRRDRLRTPIVAFTAALAGILAYYAGVPIEFTPYIIGIGGILVNQFAFPKSRERSGLEILDSLRGVQRP